MINFEGKGVLRKVTLSRHFETFSYFFLELSVNTFWTRLGRLHSTSPAIHFEVKSVFINFVHCFTVLEYCARQFKTFVNKFRADFSELHHNYPEEKIEFNQVFTKNTFSKLFWGIQQNVLGLYLIRNAIYVSG